MKSEMGVEVKVEVECTQTGDLDFSVNLDSIIPLTVCESRPPESRKCLARPDGKQTLPGQPYVRLDGPDLLPHLRSAHLTSELDRMAPFLRLTTASSEVGIPPLHHEETRGRTINITEYPGLHLVWYYGRIFVKPIPQYMMTPAFWTFIREADPDVFKAALGFMRTYFYLIRHEADFRRAKETYLIPQVDGRPAMTFEDFALFIQQFECVDDSSVSPRYHYGTLRLPWLNDLTFFTLGKLSYFRSEEQWDEWFGRTFGPIIAVFAIISVILNTMQVGLNAVQIDGTLGDEQYLKVSWGVSQFVLIVAAVISSASILLLLWVVVKEQAFALYMMKARRYNKDRIKDMKTTVID